VPFNKYILSFETNYARKLTYLNNRPRKALTTELASANRSLGSQIRGLKDGATFPTFSFKLPHCYSGCQENNLQRHKKSSDL
jgi:hypothetical protein